MDDGGVWVKLNEKSASNAVFPGRNLLYNGAMQVWQRGTIFNVTNEYSADRWMTSASANITASQQQAIGLDGFGKCLRLQRKSGTSAIENMNVIQSLESVDSTRLQGQTATLSFYCRAGADFSASDIGVWVQEGTGVDQNIYTQGYENVSTIVSDSIVPTASWVRYSFTMSVSSSCNEIGFFTAVKSSGTAGADDWYEITGVQLEVGETATPFEHKKYATELAECQRYYEKSYDQGVNPGTATLGGSWQIVGAVNSGAITGNWTIPFAVVKRAWPTFIYYSPDSGASGYVSNRAASFEGDKNTGLGAILGTRSVITAIGSGVGIGNYLPDDSSWIRAQWTAEAEL